MKTIGLIGGMSWKSTVTYYQIINETINNELGGLHSGKILLYSVDFDEIEKCQSEGDWERSGVILGTAASNLEKAGADYIVICTNTMHKVVPQIQKEISIPIIHIVDATVTRLKEKNISKVALLGTKYTMVQDFYKEKFVQSGIELLIPCEKDIEIVNDVIFNELCLGEIKEQSKKEYLRIIQELAENGAQGVVLGCTELGLLIEEDDLEIPLFDTTEIHAKKAALSAL